MGHQLIQESDGRVAVRLASGPIQEGFLALVVQGGIQSQGIDLLDPAFRHLGWFLGPGPEAIGPAHEPGLIQPHSGPIGSLAGKYQQTIPLTFVQAIQRIRAGQPFLCPSVADLCFQQPAPHGLMTDLLYLLTLGC